MTYNLTPDVLENYLIAEKGLKAVLDGNGPVSFDLLLKLSNARASAVDDLEEALARYFEFSGQTISSKTTSGNLWIMSQSLHPNYLVQITYFGPDSRPNGDMQFKTVQKAMEEMLRSTMISTFENYEGVTFAQFLQDQHTDTPQTGARSSL